MEQQKLEGIWEEILQHSAELEGKRVILTILPSPSSNETVKPTLDQTLKGRTGRVNFLPSNLSERVEEAFTRLVATYFKTYNPLPYFPYEQTTSHNWTNCTRTRHQATN